MGEVDMKFLKVLFISTVAIKQMLNNAYSLLLVFGFIKFKSFS